MTIHFYFCWAVLVSLLHCWRSQKCWAKPGKVRVGRFLLGTFCLPVWHLIFCWDHRPYQLIDGEGSENCSDLGVRNPGFKSLFCWTRLSLLCDIKQVILLSGLQFLHARHWTVTWVGSLWPAFFPISPALSNCQNWLSWTTFGPGWLKWTFNLEPESSPSLLQPSVLMFHFLG